MIGKKGTSIKSAIDMTQIAEETAFLSINNNAIIKIVRSIKYGLKFFDDIITYCILFYG